MNNAEIELDAASGPVSPMDRNSPIYVAGHRGLVGSAVWESLHARGFDKVIGRTSAELDLRDRTAVFDFFATERPVNVVLAAAKVGGILANSSYPADFISENLQIQVNVLDAALEHRVQRLLFLGSSCIYPKFAPQPMTESALLTGKLETTNDAYAIAKIAGIIQIQAVRKQHGLPWISAMPTNLYGPRDNYSPEGSHVVPALIRRFDEAHASAAPTVLNWGSGKPRRELMHVDDMASACLHLLDTYNGPSHVNVGTGTDHSIAELSAAIADAIGYEGAVGWDTTKPDGTPQKLLDIGLLTGSGWSPSIGLRDGIASTIAWYRENKASARC